MASRKRTASKQIDRTSRYVFTPPTGRCASCRNSCGRTFQLQLAQPQMTLCCASCFWKADVADTQQQSRESGQHRRKNSGTQKKRILAKGSNFHRVSPISKSVLLIATRLCYIRDVTFPDISATKWANRTNNYQILCRVWGSDKLLIHWNKRVNNSVPGVCWHDTPFWRFGRVERSPWLPDSVAKMTQIASTESKRVMFWSFCSDRG